MRVLYVTRSGAALGHSSRACARKSANTARAPAPSATLAYAASTPLKARASGMMRASSMRRSHLVARSGWDERAKPVMTEVKVTVLGRCSPRSSIWMSSASASPGLRACASAAITVLNDTSSGGGS